jgi:hypothetical protein
MLNITLTISAAPELLAAISVLTNAITGTKAVVAPQLNEAMQQPINYPAQDPAAQQMGIPQQPVQVTPTYIQPTAPVQPQQPLQNQVPIPNVPTAAQTYSMEQLAVAATQLVDAGRRTELISLLGSFGVQALTALPKEQYGPFATQLRALGAKI